MKIKRTLRINTIRRAANSKNPLLPGNLIVNATTDDPKSGKWFSNREFRNNLIGAGLPTEIALPTFLGCMITYNELTITQEMLDAGGGVHIEKVNGRDVSYKKVGVTNIEAVIDFSTINVTDSSLNLNRLVQLFGTGRRAQPPAVAATQPAQQQEEIIAEPPPVTSPATTNTTNNIVPPEDILIEEEDIITEPLN